MVKVEYNHGFKIQFHPDQWTPESRERMLQHLLGLKVAEKVDTPTELDGRTEFMVFNLALVDLLADGRFQIEEYGSPYIDREEAEALLFCLAAALAEQKRRECDG